MSHPTVTRPTNHPNEDVRPSGPPLTQPTRSAAPPPRVSGRWATSPHHAQRALWVGRVFAVLITAAMIGLLVRVAQLQTHPPVRIARLINTQRHADTLVARRGSFLDRRGHVLVSSRIARRLFADPQLIANPASVCDRLSAALGYDRDQLYRRILESANPRYVVLDPQLNDQRLAKLAQMELPGIATQRYLLREYPMQSLAGQLLGFVGSDGSGLEGLEYLLDGILSGTPGRLMYLRDVRRRPLWVDHDDHHPPAHGRSIRLSLDAAIQAIAQTQLRQTAERFAADSGQLIVMDPHNGQILAMANYPAFDPGRFTQSTPDQRRNRCVTDAFEPGSTLKPIIWSALTDAGLADPDETIDCTDAGYYVSPKGRRLRDAHPHGRITWDQVLIQSSNIGMAIVSQRVSGPEQLHAMVRAFGFGSLTGSGLPGESPGLVQPVKRWNHYSITSVPMGQEIAVTCLQLTAAYCAIANGGFKVQPTILLNPEDQPPLPPDHPTPPIYEPVLHPWTADHTRRVLRRVVTEGTGRKADSSLYAVFGKTGTAQVADRVHGGYLPDQYVASFVGAAPLDQPRIVVACVIHRPDRAKGYYGGTVAAPAVRQVIEQTLLYLGVSPDPPPSHLADRLAATHP